MTEIAIARHIVLPSLGAGYCLIRLTNGRTNEKVYYGTTTGNRFSRKATFGIGVGRHGQNHRDDTAHIVAT